MPLMLASTALTLGSGSDVMAAMLESIGLTAVISRECVRLRGKLARCECAVEGV